MDDAVMLDKDVAEFRRAGHEAIEWIADWLESRERSPVFPAVQPGDVTRRFASTPPAGGADLEQLLGDFREKVVPGMTLWNHPAFFAWFAITGSQAGLIGELLTAALNVNGMLWRSSPAATELEQVALEWVRQAIGLPDGLFGIINDTASITSFLALAAARDALGLSIREQGIAGRDLPRMTVYISDQTHSSVEKGAIALGIGQDNVRKIATDSRFRMDVDALRRAVDEDRANGIRPMCIVATVGTTSTAAVDPLAGIADVARDAGVWLHVDAAYGGAAGIAPEWRWIWEGVEHADSIVFNPHKWLFTQVDCSVLYTRHPDVLRKAFTLVPAYLRTNDAEALNYMDYGLQLGRRFRALKLWMVLAHYGIDHMREVSRGHMILAKRLEAALGAREDVAIVSPASMGVVAFRLLARDGEGLIDDAASDAATAAYVERVNRSGSAFLGTTVLQGKIAVRVAIGHGQTSWEHVSRLLEHLP